MWLWCKSHLVLCRRLKHCKIGGEVVRSIASNDKVLMVYKGIIVLISLLFALPTSNYTQTSTPTLLFTPSICHIGYSWTSNNLLITEVWELKLIFIVFHDNEGTDKWINFYCWIFWSHQIIEVLLLTESRRRTERLDNVKIELRGWWNDVSFDSLLGTCLQIK